MGKLMEIWRSGQVVRKHTMENIRAENVGEHTWGVVGLIMCCWPNVPTRVLFAAQYHDAGEIATGDMPGPTKWANPVLEAEMERLEKTKLEEILPKHIWQFMKEMNECDWAVIEFFDRIEFCLSMARERKLGNTYAMFYFGRSLEKAMRTWAENEDDFRAKDPVLHGSMDNCINEIQEIAMELSEL